MLVQKINLICEDVGATQPPIIFVTDNEWLANKQKRQFIPGFRYEFAKTKPYKGTRKNPKPFHFNNILIYLLANYQTEVAMYGMEADDLICREQFTALKHGGSTTICSRDKDLRICPGLHFSWECGKQSSVGPYETDRFGSLEIINDKFIGFGLMFFYYQMLTGDAADNIPGLPGVGHAKAFNLLRDCENEEQLFKLVKQEYISNKKLDNPKDYFLEQANLLWMQYDGPYKIPTFKEE